MNLKMSGPIWAEMNSTNRYGIVKRFRKNSHKYLQAWRGRKVTIKAIPTQPNLYVQTHIIFAKQWIPKEMLFDMYLEPMAESRFQTLPLYIQERRGTSRQN